MNEQDVLEELHWQRRLAQSAASTQPRHQSRLQVPTNDDVSSRKDASALLPPSGTAGAVSDFDVAWLPYAERQAWNRIETLSRKLAEARLRAIDLLEAYEAEPVGSELRRLYTRQHTKAMERAQKIEHELWAVNLPTDARSKSRSK